MSLAHAMVTTFGGCLNLAPVLYVSGLATCFLISNNDNVGAGVCGRCSQVAGTPLVYRLNASDQDNSPFGTITYQLTSPNATYNATQDAWYDTPIVLFASDGRIVLTSTLDYETQRVYTVGVAASDNAPPTPRHGAMTLTIVVQDVNDNPPVFACPDALLQTTCLAGNIHVGVPRALPVGAGVVQLLARDPDSVGDNSRLTWSTGANNGFAIDADTGLVRNGQALGVGSLQIQASVRDNGAPFKFSPTQANVTVTVLDDTHLVVIKVPMPLSQFMHYFDHTTRDHTCSRQYVAALGSLAGGHVHIHEAVVDTQTQGSGAGVRLCVVADLGVIDDAKLSQCTERVCMCKRECLCVCTMNHSHAVSCVGLYDVPGTAATIYAVNATQTVIPSDALVELLLGNFPTLAALADGCALTEVTPMSALDPGFIGTVEVYADAACTFPLEGAEVLSGPATYCLDSMPAAISFRAFCSGVALGQVGLRMYNNNGCNMPTLHPEAPGRSGATGVASGNATAGGVVNAANAVGVAAGTCSALHVPLSLANASHTRTIYFKTHCTRATSTTPTQTENPGGDLGNAGSGADNTSLYSIVGISIAAVLTWVVVIAVLLRARRRREALKRAKRMVIAHQGDVAYSRVTDYMAWGVTD